MKETKEAGVKVVSKKTAEPIRKIRVIDSVMEEAIRWAESDDREIIAALAGIHSNGEFLVTNLATGRHHGSYGSAQLPQATISRIVTKAEKEGKSILGDLHSHPNMSPFLSSIDRNSLRELSFYHPDTFSIVIGTKKPTSYRIYRWNKESDNPKDITKEVEIVNTKPIAVDAFPILNTTIASRCTDEGAKQLLSTTKVVFIVLGAQTGMLTGIAMALTDSFLGWLVTASLGTWNLLLSYLLNREMNR